VAECLRLAPTTSETPSGIGSAPVLSLPVASVEILRLTGLIDMIASPAGLLSHGMKQALELAMVLALQPRLILLDEPTAGLTKVERATIGTVLRHLTAEAGYAIILVEHDLDFVREISSGYGAVSVVRSVTLSVRPGEIVAELGKNGMGKSTLLKTILGLIPLRGGAIQIGGVDQTALTPARMIAWGLSYVPQEQALFQDLSIRDNLRLAVRNAPSLEPH
jgi:ABC-type branched-subunit amino acid transport system ATPase component